MVSYTLACTIEYSCLSIFEGIPYCFSKNGQYILSTVHTLKTLKTNQTYGKGLGPFTRLFSGVGRGSLAQVTHPPVPCGHR